ncbi:MAG: dTMP kinase [Thermosulfidibacteraceae bacterium]
MRRRRVVITGKPGVGKTTLIGKLVFDLKNRGFKLKGFFTREVREGSRRIGFDICDIGNGKVVPLARVGLEGKFKVSKYTVFVSTVDEFSRILLDEVDSDDGSTVFVIDEIGKMELFSREFRTLIERLLRRGNFVVTAGIINDPLNRRIMGDRSLLRVKLGEDNRDYLLDRLLVEFDRLGRLIVFEGIDGCGKTTISKMVFERLKVDYEKVVLRSEPTADGPYGRALKELLLSGGDRKLLLDLFIKDRRWHVENFIIPYLKKGYIVLLDRYYISTITYQGAQGFDVDDLIVRCETIAPLPDRVIYLDIPVDVALGRLNDRSQKTLFERSEFLEKVKDIYRDVLSLFEVSYIDGTENLEDIVDKVCSEVRKILP